MTPSIAMSEPETTFWRRLTQLDLATATNAVLRKYLDPSEGLLHLIAKKRGREYDRARAEVMQLLEDAGLTHQEVADLFQRDVTSVTHALATRRSRVEGARERHDETTRALSNLRVLERATIENAEQVLAFASAVERHSRALREDAEKILDQLRERDRRRWKKTRRGA